MTKEDVTQIKVANHSVGIMGLKNILEEMAPEYAGRPEDEAGEELLWKLSKKNYIPDKARENYKRAFLREFRKFLGRPCEEEVASGLEIKVLGPGCPQCDMLEQELMAVVSQLQLKAGIEHVRDIKEIGRYGVMGMPGLIINGEVKSVGRVPSRASLIQWLEEINH